MPKLTRPFRSEPLEKRMLLDAVPVGPEFQVNTYTTAAQSKPSIAMHADGDFVVAWHSYLQDGSLQGIYGQRYNAVGVPQGSEFQVNTYTTNQQLFPSIAMDGEGNFVVAWNSQGQDGSLWGVYAQRYNAAGVPLDSEFRVNSWTTGGQGGPSIAMHPDGHFVMSWAGSGLGDDDGIFAQRHNAAGVPQGSEFRVNTSTANYQQNSSVAMDADGDFVITWETRSLNDAEIYAQRYNAQGVPLGGEFRVNTWTNDVQARPRVATNAGGDFVIVWDSHEQDGSYGIYAQRYNAAGIPQGDEFRINTYTTSDQFRPAIAMDADGAFVVAWDSFNQDGSGRGVYAKRFNAHGMAQGSEFSVNTYTTSFQWQPSVAMDSDGDFAITWESSGQDGASRGVFAQRFAVVPEVTADAFLFDSSPHRLRFDFSRDVRDSLSVDDLVIENLTTGQTIPSDQFTLLYDSDYNVATFMYVGSGTELIGGVLPDGSYRGTLVAAGVTTPAGASLADDHIFNFFFLNGDANRDGVVNLADFNVLAANFGQTGRDFAQGDFNYDGVVNLSDFNILAARFGTSIGVSPFGGGASMPGDAESDADEELATDGTRVRDIL